MSKVRVNFIVDKNLYSMVQDIAMAEDSNASEIFRKAARKFVYEYKEDKQNQFYLKEKSSHSSAKKLEEIDD